MSQCFLKGTTTSTAEILLTGTISYVADHPSDPLYLYFNVDPRRIYLIGWGNTPSHAYDPDMHLSESGPIYYDASKKCLKIQSRHSYGWTWYAFTE